MSKVPGEFTAGLQRRAFLRSTQRHRVPAGEQSAGRQIGATFEYEPGALRESLPIQPVAQR
jgi:hypothetical protein